MNTAIILLFTSFLATVPVALQLPSSKNKLKDSEHFTGEQPQATNSSSGLQQVGAVYIDQKSENARLVVQIDNPPLVGKYHREWSSIDHWLGNNQKNNHFVGGSKNNLPASYRPRGELCGGPSVQC
ncbi:uncharacterized protein LOC120840507, partial [Ixodes scapularis]|uniref:uncharacterized protein LOC120840507 n=1 Tax=Ixodes scapularis TaxID=6945 RepID=UPI001C393387